MKKSTLLEEKNPKEIESPDYSQDEIGYLGNLRQKIRIARDKRESGFKEFDGMSFTQYWNKCEELANTYIEPKKNKEDVTYKAGTLRQKLFAMLSTILGLNLEPDITTYTMDNIPLARLGNAMETIIWKTNEIDNDEEKKLLRFYELIVRGFVFVEELWEEQYITEKPKLKDWSGKFRGVEIKPKKVKCMSKATRNIIPSTSVFLGDLTKNLITEQPFIYTCVKMRYDTAERIWGDLEMWKYVQKKVKPFEESVSASSSQLWFFDECDEDYVEVIKYQDKPNNEYQIIINGIPMLPIGFGFPWGYDEYNITQQNLRPIRHDFAYGKSFLFENKNIAELIDSFTRYNLLKTLKSLFPPYINVSTKVITNSVLTPGKISMGIPPGALQPISQKETDGVTQSEFMMLEGLIKNLDQNTLSQTFTGQQERKTGVTATQILELQKQSKIMLGIIITCCALLEQKLSVLRLYNIIENWFDDNEKIEGVKKAIDNKYRVVMRDKLLPGEGEGTEIVYPVDGNIPSSEETFWQEEVIKFNTGKAARIIYLNPKQLKALKLLWVVSVNPREKKTSELSKIMFGQMIQEAIGLGLPLNMKYVSERFAQVWEEDPSKLFSDIQPMPQSQEITNQGQKAGVPNPNALDNIMPNLPEKPQPPMPDLN